MGADPMLSHPSRLGLLSHHRRAHHYGLALLHDVRIRMGDQALGGGPGSVRVVADDQVGPQPERDRATIGSCLGRDPFNTCADLLQWLNPQQVYVSESCGQRLGTR
jgi:hypothetical protein